MKKIIGLLVLLLLVAACAAAAADVAIDQANFPDEAFRTLVRKFDRDGDGSLSDAELQAVTRIDEKTDLSYSERRQFRENVKSLQGIGFFPALKELYVTNSGLTALDLSGNTKLETVHCYSSQLSSLNVKNCTALKELNCDSNPLTELDLSDNKKLKTLVCGNVKLNSLDLSDHPELTKVLCEQWCYGYNDLSGIDIRNCPNLLDLVLTSCYGDISTDLFPDQVCYCHVMHGWFTDQNGDGNLDNTTDRCLLVCDSAKVVTDAGVFYGKNLKEGTPDVKFGKCGENLAWTMDSRGVLTISGTGEITEATWTADEVREVMIGEGVTGIGPEVFSGCRNLENVAISGTVVYIGYQAFADCISLTGVHIPAGVTGISGYYDQFAGCVNLAEIDVDPQNPAYASIEGVLFDKRAETLLVCPEGKSGGFVIPDTVKKIIGGLNSDDHGAFQGCGKLTAVMVPGSVEYIDWCTFAGCGSLAELTIRDGVEGIGGLAFSGCDSLVNVTLPDRVKEIGNGAFAYCTSLTAVTLPDSMAYIGSDYTFGGGVFTGCRSLTAVTIPKNTTTITRETFSGCSHLAGITIPEGVTGISEGAFEGCSSLTDVYYAGTEDRWNRMEIEEEGNAPLLGATVHFAGKQETGEEIEINGNHFPDAAFHEHVKQYDTSGNGKLDRNEIGAVTEMNVEYSGIKNLKGIEIFTALTDLDCSGNPLEELDMSGNQALLTLKCRYTDSLKKLDVSGCTGLISLECDENMLEELDVSRNTALEYLNCDGNRLTALDVSHCPGLKELYCGTYASSASGNDITELVLKNHKALRSLSCINMPLRMVDVSGCPLLADLVKDGERRQFETLEYDYWSDGECYLAVGRFARVVTGSSPGDNLPGDVNGDGEVDGRDTIRLMNYLADETDPETGETVEISLFNADVTGDGEVNEKDLLRLVRYLGGEDVALKSGTLTIY